MKQATFPAELVQFNSPIIQSEISCSPKLYRQLRETLLSINNRVAKLQQ